MGGPQDMFSPAGPAAAAIANLSWLFIGVCAFFYVLTMLALVWAIVRRRRPSDDDPATARRLGLVVGGTIAVVTVTLVGLTVTSVVAGRGLTAPAGPRPLTIDVIGHQWWWEFQYQDPQPNETVNSPNELHIPVGVPVVLRAISRDVIHSFWVPNLHGKRDLIPGTVTHTWIQADQPGVYRGQCAEFCGHQHAHMAFFVVAEPRPAFERWLQAQRQSASEPQTDVERRGHDVFMQGPCVLCHTIRGTQAGSRVGPDLTHVASRRSIAAGTLPMTRGHLTGWVSDAQSIKPGTRMPPNLVSGADLQAVVSYLESLR